MNLMYSIVIQAGGNSSRMGVDKSFISLCGKPLIKHVIKNVKRAGNEIIITTNDTTGYSNYEFILVPDYYPNYGALAGLHAGIKAAKNDRIIVVANDMPFINIALVEYMKDLMKAEVDVVIPQNNKGLEPFHAIYRKSTCLPAIEKAIQQNSKRIISWFPAVKVQVVDKRVVESMDPEGLAFFNVNTPEELCKAEQIIANRRSGNSSPITR